MTPIKQALISVSDKTGVVELASELTKFGILILSTGGTAKLLQQHGIRVTEISDYTGFPEMLDGRVKTLHPKVHAGILARRDLPAHAQAIAQAKIPTIDLVVVNLYPFASTVAKPNCPLEEAIENIDIGGPALIRAAAKNYRDVTVITDHRDYDLLISEMKSSKGSVSLETRFKLATKAFSHTAEYDGVVSNYLTSVDEQGKRIEFPQRLNLSFTKMQDLRYGENPHQNAAFYRENASVPGALSGYKQIQGKELSYNNLGDSDAAWECVKTFASPACVIIKHANPCGVAIGKDLLEAYKLAFATDPTSAFGGIIAFNREVDAMTAEAVIQQFAEVVIAPKVGPVAAKVFEQKPNIRVLEIGFELGGNSLDYRRIGGGLLVQTPDSLNVNADNLRVMTKLKPTPKQFSDMLFAWRVAKFVKSNAIIFVGNGQTLGVGAGQMSRVDSARIASIKAQNAGLNLSGSVVASDAFFPFRDGLDVVAQAGAKAVVQPGGSLRDDEVIAAANEHGITMVFTGVRHFRH